jgi:hypothetical protein
MWKDGEQDGEFRERKGTEMEDSEMRVMEGKEGER